MNKKEDIFHAALKLFVEKGEQSTSMNLISKEAKCGMGTMYNYFPSKEDLMNKLYVYVKNEMWKFAFKDFDTTAPVKSRLFHTWSGIIDFGLREPLKYKYLALFSDTCKITDQSKEITAEMDQYMLEIYEEGKRQGIIKNIDTMQLILFINGAITKNMINYPHMPEEYKNRLLTLAWDAIKS